MDKQSHTDVETLVALGADLRVNRAGEVFKLLTTAADSGGVIVIDGAEVSKIDAAGLQMLTAVAMQFRAAGTSWRWRNGSPALVSAAKMLGLEEVLELR